MMVARCKAGRDDGRMTGCENEKREGRMHLNDAEGVFI